MSRCPREAWTRSFSRRPGQADLPIGWKQIDVVFRVVLGVASVAIATLLGYATYSLQVSSAKLQQESAEVRVLEVCMRDIDSGDAYKRFRGKALLQKCPSGSSSQYLGRLTSPEALLEVAFEEMSKSCATELGREAQRFYEFCCNGLTIDGPKSKVSASGRLTCEGKTPVKDFHHAIAVRQDGEEELLAPAQIFGDGTWKGAVNLGPQAPGNRVLVWICASNRPVSENSSFRTDVVDLQCAKPVELTVSDGRN